MPPSPTASLPRPRCTPPARTRVGAIDVALAVAVLVLVAIAGATAAPAAEAALPGQPTVTLAPIATPIDHGDVTVTFTR